MQGTLATDPQAGDIKGVYLTMPELCEYLRVSRSTIYDMMSAEEITGYRIHKQTWLFKRSEIDAYVESQRDKPKARQRKAGEPGTL